MCVFVSTCVYSDDHLHRGVCTHPYEAMWRGHETALVLTLSPPRRHADPLRLRRPDAPAPCAVALRSQAWCFEEVEALRPANPAPSAQIRCAPFDRGMGGAWAAVA